MSANSEITDALDISDRIRYQRSHDASDALDTVRDRITEASDALRERYFQTASAINHEIIQDPDCDAYDLTTYGTRAHDALAELAKLYATKHDKSPLTAPELDRAQRTVQLVLNVLIRIRDFVGESSVLHELPLDFFRPATFKAYLDYLYSCPSGAPAKDEGARIRVVCSDQCQTGAASVVARAVAVKTRIDGLKENVSALRRRLNSCPSPKPL